MKKHWIPLIGLIVIGLAGPRVAFGQANPGNSDQLSRVIEKLDALERRLGQLEEKVNAQTNPSPSASSSAQAAVASSDIGSQLEVLDQAIRIAERKRELDQETAASAVATVPVVVADGNGFRLQSNNGDYRIDFGLVAQTDGRFSLDTPTPTVNTFILRKLRPTLTGRVAKFFDYKVMPDFGSGSTVIQDAYFDTRFSTAFRVRSGKDKTPVGYELLQGDAFLLFPERSLASSLVPNRDISIQALGDFAGGRFSYSGGVFNGIPDGTSTTTDVDTNNDKDLAGRVLLQPFKSRTPAGVWNGLGFHIGGSIGDEAGPLPSFKTSAGQTYFSYNSTAVANGVRRRLSPAVFYYYKSLGVFGEYMLSNQVVSGGGINTTVRNHAWEATASFLLTGEVASDRGIRPKKPFDPTKGQWGALQLLARYTQLTIDPDAFTAGLAATTASSEARSFTIGTNWYPAGPIKYYATYERTVFDGVVRRPPEHVILFRTQLAF